MNCPKCHLDNPGTSRYCSECGTSLRETPGAVAATMTLETPRDELATGSTFAGRYQIIEELGKGGMGHVYKAYDREVNAKVALKLIKPEVASDPGTIERFRNELRLAREVSQKHICRMYDLGREGRLYYITMEYVPGEDLKAMIRMSGHLGVGTVVTIARQLCEGLAEAHRRGIIHRDLKPSNVMIDRDGQVRILDFGIARSVRSSGLTEAGVVVGTPEYMSPEQVEGAKVDPRSDIYSLGIILYEALVGRVPFTGDTPLTVGIKQKTEKPGDPRDLNPNIPEDLSRLVLRCLEKDPARRYASAEELGEELDRIAKRIPLTERALPRRKPSTSRTKLTVGLKKAMVPSIFLAAGLLAVAGWSLFFNRGAPAASSPRHSVAVLTFENQTGDSSYDYLGKAIPSLLITSLEQSRDLSVMTWERMRDVVRQMGRDGAAEIDSDLGFELCRREGVRTIVLGSFIKAGDAFATDVKILDVETKRLLKSAGSKGDGLRSILDRQIGELSREIVRGVGLSARSVPSKGTEIAATTTSSMDAYHAYLKGTDLFERFSYDEARKMLQEAVKLDPGFAVAYLALGRVHGALGDAPAMEQAYKKAMSLAGKCPEKERLSIEAFQAGAIEHDWEKNLKILIELSQKYPKEKSFHFDLGKAYKDRMMYPEAIAEFQKAVELDPKYGYALNMLAYTFAEAGEFPKAIDVFKKYAAVSPGEANPLDSLAETYFRMGDLEKSLATYKQALAVNPKFYASYWGLAYVHALREEYPEALKAMDDCIAVSPSDGLKGRGTSGRAFLLSWTGRFEEAVSGLEDLAEGAAANRYVEGLTSTKFLLSIVRIRQGRLGDGLAWIDRWDEAIHGLAPAGEKGHDLLLNAVKASADLARGRVADARAKLEALLSLLPKDTGKEKNPFAVIRDRLTGEVLLAEGRVAEAIAALESAKAPGKAPEMQSILSIYNAPLPKDGLARAYLAQGALDKAIAEYEKITAFDARQADRTLIDPVHHYRLARLYERKGLPEKALGRYKRFLVAWKSADRDLPELVDTKARLAALSR